MRFKFNTIFYVQYRSEEISPGISLLMIDDNDDDSIIDDIAEDSSLLLE